MSVVDDVLSVIGLSPRIAESILRASVQPTSANIRAVVKAYLENGQTPPVKLMGYLIQQNRAVYPNDPYIDVSGIVTTAFPWGLAVGAIVLVYLFGRKR